MEIPTFLTTEEALYIHAKEIEAAGGAGGLKDFTELEAAINAPRAALGLEIEMSIIVGNKSEHGGPSDATVRR